MENNVNNPFGDLKPELVDMADYSVSGDGYTAISYEHKDGRRMMKLYAPYMPPSVPIQELNLARSIEALGLRVPKAIRLVTDGERLGVEFERIVGKRSFARAISQEPEMLEVLTARFAKACLKLHSLPCDTQIFHSAKAHFRKMVEVSKDLSDDERARFLAFVDAVPDITTCLHGDMHIGNIITSGGVDYWIDLADFRYGDPRFDLGMLYFVCVWNENEDISDRVFHLSHAQMLRVWDVFVKNYYGPDADRAAVDDSIRPFAALYMVHFSNREPMMPEMRKFIDNCFSSSLL